MVITLYETTFVIFCNTVDNRLSLPLSGCLYSKFHKDALFDMKILYILFGIKNEVCRIYCYFTGMHKRFPLQFCLCGKIVYAAFFKLRHFKYNDIDTHD